MKLTIHISIHIHAAILHYDGDYNQLFLYHAEEYLQVVRAQLLFTEQEDGTVAACGGAPRDFVVLED